MRLEELGESIRGKQTGNKVAVITDSNVAPLYLDRCRQSLKAAGFGAEGFVVPAGEEHKNGETYLALIERLAGAGVTRRDGIAALGGGMIGDLAGFVAATYMRGIRFYQVPTTLLSMVDSSIGGKTGINLREGKNLAGVFYTPDFILRDPSLLATLPEEGILEGLAEVVKYGMIRDADLFETVEKAVSEGTVDQVLEELIARCAAIKQEYVQEDPYDYGIRNELNFGHTIGHAIEAMSGYAVPHGFAVAKGMELETKLACQEGWCGQETYKRLHGLLTKMGYDLSLGADREAVASAVLLDKKRIDDTTIRLITPDRIGVCRVREFGIEELKELIRTV